MKRMVVDTVEDDVDELIERSFRAPGEFLRGNPEPLTSSPTQKTSPSPTPMALPYVGEEVSKGIEHAASLRRDGTFVVAVRSEVRNCWASLRSTDRPGRGQGRRKGGHHPVSCAGYDEL